MPKAPGNARLARWLREAADLLLTQRGDPFRVRAYRRAADTVAALDRPLADLLREGGIEALVALPTIGTGLAQALGEAVRTGRLGLLTRLRGGSDPQAVLTAIPVLGPVLADRIHHELGIGTLEELEQAAWDGRLGAVRGIGPRRLAAITAALAGRLGRRPAPPRPAPPPDRPGVAQLLAVDREYRRKAKAGELPTITPRRFNPERRAWLPILHTRREGRAYTALHSNTARAHRLGRTGDWVVIYYDGTEGEGQATVVTERVGPLRGRRVVRGREAESARHYGLDQSPAAPVETDAEGVI